MIICSSNFTSYHLVSCHFSPASPPHLNSHHLSLFLHAPPCAFCSLRINLACFWPLTRAAEGGVECFPRLHLISWALLARGEREGRAEGADEEALMEKWLITEEWREPTLELKGKDFKLTMDAGEKWKRKNWWNLQQTFFSLTFFLLRLSRCLKRLLF